MAIVMSVNAGSSSFKFQVFEMPEEKVLAQGNVERIGLENSIFGMKFDGNKIEEVCDIPDHAVAVQKIMDALVDNHIVNQLEDIQAIGHRMVHGGEYFDHSVLESEDAINKFIELTDLAPLHNPAGLLGYRSFKKALPNASHTFVFDTAFHQTMPKENYLYAIPYEYYEKDKVRRYGMHGTSHLYLTQRYAQITGKKLEDVNIVTCHLGNGGSITAVKNGKSFKTSMGFTPLAGIMMGTRCGDIDPAILVFLQKKYGYDYEEIDNLLIQELSKKNTLLVSGENINIVDNDDGTQTISSFNTFVLDYLLTENKPSLNSVILEGNKFAHDFGLANLSDLPLSVSDLENDVGYLTQHQDISGKADKSTTLEGYGIKDAYTKDEVDSIFFSYIGDIETLLSEV